MTHLDEDDRIEALEERIQLLEHALASIRTTAKVAHTWARYALDQAKREEARREDCWL